MISFSVTTANSTITLATTEEFQAISSPNYPRNNWNEEEITITIHSPTATFVELIFLEFSFEPYCLNPLYIQYGKLNYII